MPAPACVFRLARRSRYYARTLTPYAVALRYDDEFWPSVETARQALDAAITIRDFVLARLPTTTNPAEP
ncbi:MAG: hypothetical protein IID41_16575 [Planctomycetes bacterium]|nr:hypothetical protein [Planctomycetota bacterium]